MTTPTSHDEITQAESLYAGIQGTQPHNRQSEEADLAQRLQALAHAQQPEPQFVSSLEAQLAAVQRAALGGAERVQPAALQNPSGGRRSSVFATLGWFALAALLIFGLSWIFRNLLPEPQPAATQPVIVTNTPAPAVLPGELPSPTPQAAPTMPPTPIGKVYTSLLLNLGPDGGVVLNAPLPSQAPAEMAIFQQTPLEPLTPANALLVGQKFNLPAVLYRDIMGRPDGTTYMLTDGKARLSITDSPQTFEYNPDMSLPYSRPPAYPPSQTLLQSAQRFLESRALLDFPYQAVTTTLDYGKATFAQSLDGYPISADMFTYPGVSVSFDSQGDVLGVSSNRLNFTRLKSVPIISAAQAWNKVTDPNDTSGMQMTDIYISPAVVKAWMRAYPDDTPVELFGYVSYYPALEAGQPGVFFLNSAPLQGAVDGLEKMFSSPENSGFVFVQATGRYQAGPDGGRVFNLESWQISPFTSNLYVGEVERDGADAYLVMGGQRLRLPELPAEVPQGDELQVSAVRLEGDPPVLDWSNITQGVGSGGGGGGGGGFMELNLDADSNALPATPIPLPTPMAQTGQRLDGAQGKLWLTVHHYSDDQRQYRASITFDPTPQWPNGLTVDLTGSDLASMEAYHLMPVRVWGEFVDGANYNPDLKIERFEPVYPGLKPLSLTGTGEVITLDGREVILFTAENGDAYVLNSSIQDADPQEVFFKPQDALVVFGVAYPDQALGGYPILEDRGLLAANSMSPQGSFSTIQPPVIEEQGQLGQPKIAFVELVELIYYTDMFNTMMPQIDQLTHYIQPVWRFSGHYADGRAFLILVQAVQAQYLK